MSMALALNAIEQKRWGDVRRGEGADFHRSTWSEASQRASVLGVGILFKARQLRAHHGPCLEGDGEPLKETLTAIAHPYGGAPPLSPAEALPAALACVDFCVVALPALLDSASTTDEGVLATLKSAASNAASKVASTVDQVLWEEENVDIATCRGRPSRARSTDAREGTAQER